MIKMKFGKKKPIFTVAMLPFLLLSAQAFGQSASLSGTVTDASQAVLPGAIITATNTTTEIKTTVTTNNAGVYNFAAMPPGTYEVTAEMPGFQIMTRTDVTLGLAATLSLNFELEVSGVATQIEVSASAADLLLESSSGTGTVMNERVVKALPLVGNDLMQFINIMGGVVKAENSIFGASNQTFAGIKGNDINLTRDGITVSNVTLSSGIISPGRLNPEMVGEFKLILTPIDAEMGRGGGQVRILTKSGGNELHGSSVWSVLNPALDAREWDDNRTGAVPDWKNVNQYTLSTGGPIMKNRTFLFVTWDHNIVRQRQEVIPNVLTPCARKGIYRYFPGWIPGNVDSAISRNFGAQVRPSVDEDGTPLIPTDTWDGQPYTDELVWGSVLGELAPEAVAQIAADPINCSQYNFGIGNTGIVPGANWDPWRAEYDTSGYIDRFSSIMPLPNHYYEGDGLNVAAHRWTRTANGQDTVYGSGLDSARKSITFKIDHNINAEHRFSVMYSYESSFSDTAGVSWPPPYGFGDAYNRKPQTFTATLTSTLRPTLLNEFRFGLAYNASHSEAPLDNKATGRELEDLLQTLLPTDSFPNWTGLPIYIFPGNGETRFQHLTGGSHPVGGLSAGNYTYGSEDYRWTFADTVTWTQGSHSLKFGAEIRLTNANYDMNGWAQLEKDSHLWHPVVFGGNSQGGYSQPSGLAAAGAHWPGMVGQDRGNDSSGTYSSIYNLMNYMAGSVSIIRQFYFVNDPFANTWSDPSKPDGRTRYLRMNQNEFAFFFKDDWKVNSDLTLNLGIRYEYYGVPWMLNGMTVGIKGGAERIFGGQAGGFDQWLQGVPEFDPDNLTEQHFIGSDSPNPDQQMFSRDLNNWGPAVGFAWQLPWFGKGKTTLRGGYQVSYLSIARMNEFMNVAGNQPGLLYPYSYGGDSENYPYMDIAMLEELVPTSMFWNENTPVPLQVIPVTDRTQTVRTYDPNIRSPYIQSLTLALTRQIGSSLTVDVRYIGTLGRKQVAVIDLNTYNWLYNGLKEAFDIARAGGESELLDQMLPPNSLWYSFLGGPSGADQLRSYYLTSGSLATGDYSQIASVLRTENGLIPTPAGVQGNLLRSSGFPENFIFTNPQFENANWHTNLNHTNYHSLQGQVALRPAHGLSFQATYTWSRNLGIRWSPYGYPTDPLNRALDYGILSNHRSHMLTTYGTYNLPLGSGGYLLRDSAGWVKKLVEGWQLSWISSLTSGLPASITTVESMWSGGMPDLVRPDLFDTKGGHVSWEPSAPSGRFYGDRYVQVDDPQCEHVAAVLQNACRQNLNALALADDPSVIVFQKPLPGERGNFDPNQIMGPGRWGLDLAMSKSIEFMEGKSLNFRVDATNIFNHPTPSGGAPNTFNTRDYSYSNPTLNLNGSQPFGYIGYKGGHRVFSAKVRITF